jgi:hypothetical protein
MVGRGPDFRCSPYFAHHAVPANLLGLGAFRYHVSDLGRCTHQRLSQKNGMTKERATKVVRHGFRYRGSFIHSLTGGSPSKPEVGAECLNRARSLLCGGRSAMNVQTTIGGGETHVIAPPSGTRDTNSTF